MNIRTVFDKGFRAKSKQNLSKIMKNTERDNTTKLRQKSEIKCGQKKLN